MSQFPTIPNSLNDFGGPKVDYVAIVDPRTDRSADEINNCFNSCAEMTNTIPQSLLIFSGSSEYNIVPSFHRSLWGSSLIVRPTINSSQTVTGSYILTFPESFVDELNRECDVNLKAASVCLSGDEFGLCRIKQLTPNSFQVDAADVSGVRQYLTGSTFTVVVY